MRRATFLIITLVSLLLFTGCAKEEKKPEMKPDLEPQTIVVPEVSNIPFDIVKLEEAPDVVRKVAKTMEDQEFFNWITDNGNGYIIIVPNGKNSSNDIEIDKIEQRVPSENYAWLNVKLKYSAEREQENENEPVIARFDLRNTPNAVGFQLDRKKETFTAQPKPQPQPTQPEQKAVEKTKANDKEKEDDDESIKGPAIRITNPMAGDAVSSPVVVSGQVGFMNGNARVRVVNSAGKVIAEKPVEIKENKFETTLSFPSPASQEQGMVEAFLMNPKDNSEVSRISIYVTLLPSQ